MSVACLLILEFCIGFTVPGIATTHPAPDAGGLTRSAAEPVKPITVIEGKSLAALVRSNRKVYFKGAIIRGPLDLSYMTINQQISLVNCVFEDPADFSYSVFKSHLILENSTFKKGLDFEGATIDLNARFDAIQILSGKASFKDLHVQGLLNLEKAQFDSAAKPNFANAHIDKGAYFGGIVFGGEVILTEMRIGGDLVLTQAHFKQVARFGTTKVGGSLFLESAQFDGPVHLVGIETGYSAKLTKATFQKQVGFDEIEVKSFLDLSGSKFEWSGKPVSFSRAHVVGGAMFDDVHFAGGARFDNAHFNSDASFENAVFVGIAQFNKAHFDQTAHFETCVFKKDAFFNETSFGTADFARTGEVVPGDTAGVNDTAQIKKDKAKEQFQGRLDLRGSTYRRIQLHWQSALSVPDGTPRLIGNDKQPYSELEKFLRDTGDSDGADGVLLEWHRVKRQEMFHSSKLEWLLDCFSWLLTNYGVAPARLLDFSAILLIFGMLIFSLPGAVTPREEKQQPANPSTTGKDRLNHWDAFALSFHEFLPLEVPFGSRWTAGDEPVHLNLRLRRRVLNVVTIRPSTCGTLLKISGYILVPLEILIVNGLIQGG